MPFVRIWIHLIWSTKNREKLVTEELKPVLINHILENAKKKEIYVDKINCVEDHCHMLLSLGRSQRISEIAFLIKGESSHWINTNKLCKSRFEWQEEYIAVSVSDSQIEKVRAYIKNQNEHHRKRSFKYEYELFTKKYGFSKLG
ncbi:MAG: IS200/IS605 family transposase [Calditrichaceae bacterium]